ncbi:DUF362 domain-containing protein [Chloroflexota bacterium]
MINVKIKYGTIPVRIYHFSQANKEYLPGCSCLVIRVILIGYWRGIFEPVLPAKESDPFIPPHQRQLIAEINTACSPDLVVLDGVDAFINGGPVTGTRVQAGVILAGQ